VVLTTLPVVADLVGAFAARRWVYYCLDDYAAWPGWDSLALRRCEQRLLARLDRLVVANHLLLDRFAHYRGPVLWLSHGVDLDHFASVPHPAIPTAAHGLWQPPPRIPSPWIVYWGLIDARLDAHWLAELSRQLRCGLSTASIVLVGRCDCPPSLLTSLANLYILPSVRYDDLPILARQAAVLIAPYRQASVTQAMQPLKFLEYLATGKPVVARRLPALERWADSADLVDHAQQFAEMVLQRLHTGLPVSQQQARRRLQAESWDAKAELLERWLFAD
jgi:glycosyltransferase involved in cell wall biosynthesis